MLRPIGPAELPPPLAYRVPWTVDRTDAAHPGVTNEGRDPADFVRVFHADADGQERTQLWGQVLPGERVELCLCTADLEEVVVTVAWFRQQDGLEYVWRFVV
ncbi:hypothetical protein [Microbacterium sp. CIAB417]|uniref:hypothetical protein n=1 Tax=Microbacterium sp. CIAB417 TaxID=2860287 RepID=UPI001FAC5DA2|nr:hypothetical protein [Microbacterium sp. CIAB417]